MRLFGGEGFRNTMGKLGMGGGEPLHHPLINKSLQRAQNRVEDRNYEIRKHLLEYDDVVSKQRNSIYKMRDSVLSGNDLSKKVLETGQQILEVLIEDYQADMNANPEHALSRLGERLMQNFNYREQGQITVDTGAEEVRRILTAFLESDIEHKSSMIGREQMELFIRYEYLRQVDNRWQEHLEVLTALGESVRLRSYAQKNPLVEYKNEGFELFENMLDDLRIAIARTVFKVKVKKTG